MTQAPLAPPGYRERPVTLDLRGDRTPVALLAKDLWQARGLILVLSRQEFKARYRSTSLGVLWSVFLPVVQGGVLALVFTHVVHINGVRGYPVFVLSGMGVWTYFSASLAAGSTAIVDQSAVAGRVYFPRVILPLVPVLANTAGLLLSLLVALALSPVFGVTPGASWLLLPLVVVLIIAETAMISALVSLAHVYYRDMRYVVTAVLLVAIYATPVIYPVGQAHNLKLVLIANPVSGAVSLAHAAALGRSDYLAPTVLSSVAWLLALVVVASIAYSRNERLACDRL